MVLLNLFEFFSVIAAWIGLLDLFCTLFDHWLAHWAGTLSLSVVNCKYNLYSGMSSQSELKNVWDILLQNSWMLHKLPVCPVVFGLLCLVRRRDTLKDHISDDFVAIYPIHRVIRFTLYTGQYFGRRLLSYIRVWLL